VLPTAPLFVSLKDDGLRLKYNGLRALLKRLSDRAGVADVDAHRFRRTFAIESLRAGMPIMQLAAMMGHGSLPVLQRYLKLISDDLEQAHRDYGPVAAMLDKDRKR
jgi:site-specific recombinase XerD